MHGHIGHRPFSGNSSLLGMSSNLIHILTEHNRPKLYPVFCSEKHDYSTQQVFSNSPRVKGMIHIEGLRNHPSTITNFLVGTKSTHIEVKYYNFIISEKKGLGVLSRFACDSRSLRPR